MTLKEILSKGTPAEQVSALKIRQTPAPNMEELKSQFEPKGHKVNDRSLRPDKPIKEERTSIVNGVQKKEMITIRFEEVNRAAISLQKKIVNTAVNFLLANPVIISSQYDKGSDIEKVFKAVDNILEKNKVNSINRTLARSCFSFKEVAEYWYTIPVGQDNEGNLLTSNEYGIPSRHKLRCSIFSPDKGDELYPLFDDHGDMVAFSRQYYKDDEQGKEVAYFETYTETQFVKYIKRGGGQWEQNGDPVANPIGKIPVVYISQPATEWEDVQPLIERLEKSLSNAGDTNDYHSSPKIFINGKVTGFSKKGEAGAIIEGEKDTKAAYMGWDHAPESVKYEQSMLLKLIYSLTYTPDISFESVKGLGNISGIALKLLFMDAHLKCYDKIETFDTAFTRRYSILRSYIGHMSTKFKKAAEEANIKSKFTPFIIEDKKELVETLVTANGGKPIIDQKRSIELGGMSNDPDETFEELQKQKKQEAKEEIFY